VAAEEIPSTVPQSGGALLSGCPHQRRYLQLAGDASLLLSIFTLIVRPADGARCVSVHFANQAEPGRILEAKGYCSITCHDLDHDGPSACTHSEQ
jgi:hypothetical protein